MSGDVSRVESCSGVVGIPARPLRTYQTNQTGRTVMSDR